MPDSIVTLHLNNASNRDIASYPVTYGVPLPQGAVKSAPRPGRAGRAHREAAPDARARSLA